MIDMRHHPDGSYHWTGHYMDHVLFPLKQKCAKQVALSLMTKVFCYFGSSRIIQSDNGRNAIVRRVVKRWPGEMTTVNNLARHQQLY